MLLWDNLTGTRALCPLDHGVRNWCFSLSPQSKFRRHNQSHGNVPGLPFVKSIAVKPSGDPKMMSEHPKMMVSQHTCTQPSNAWPLVLFLAICPQLRISPLHCKLSESKAEALKLTKEEELFLLLDNCISAHCFL